LVTGLTYGLLGVGMTLTYRASRVLNFAHGQIGALAGVLVPLLVINRGMSWPLAVTVALVVAVGLGGLMERLVIRPLRGAPRLVAMVATIGVAQLLFVLDAFIPKGDLGRSTYPTPMDWRVTVGNLVLGPGQLMILVAVPLIVGGVTVFLLRTSIGTATRAASENEESALLAGVPVERLSLLIWALAGLVAGLSAILVGPTRPVLSAVALGPTLLARALAAAMIGRLDRFPVVFAAGTAIGVVEALILWNHPTGGLVEVVILVLVLVSLLFASEGATGDRVGGGSTWSLVGSSRTIDVPGVTDLLTRWRRRGFLVVIPAAVLLPLIMSNAQQVLYSNVMIVAMIGLSLVVLTGMAGQVSFGQFAFVSLGALVGGRLLQLGFWGPTALMYSALAGALAAVVVGVPALRLRGIYLAAVTLQFAIAFDSWAYRQPWLVSTLNGTSSMRIERPILFGVDLDDERIFAWVALAALLVTGVLVRQLRASGIGRTLAAVRDNEPAAATLGISPRRAKLTAFAVSGGIAGAGGFLLGALFVDFSADPQAVFGVQESLVIVGLVILGGVTSVAGPIVGAAGLLGLGYFLAPLTGDILGPRFAILLSGAGLLLAILQNPGGVVAQGRLMAERLATRLAGGDRRESAAGAAGTRQRRSLPAAIPIVVSSRDPESAPVLSAPPLQARDIEVRFGGNVAVNGVSLTARAGEIVGLIGPNGAGKTTLFDVLSGHLRPAAGSVHLGEVDVTRLAPEARAELGLARTFQQARLFDDLLVREVLALALEVEERSELVPSMLALPPSRRAEQRKRARVEELVDLLGLGDFAHRAIRELSTGTRRFIELGCVVALGSPVILLDEPTAGVAQREVEAFRPVLREIQQHLGATMVLIEHDIPLVMDVCDRVLVQASGIIIAEGTPDEVRSDPAVIAAYLGTDERVLNRSGHVEPAS